MSPTDGGGDPPESPVSDSTREALEALARGCQKYGFYGATHPSAREAGEEAAELLADRIEDRGTLSLGIAPDRLYVGGRDLGGGSALLTSLAEQLHAHDLARLTFRRGFEEEQLHAFLSGAAPTPREPGERLGRSPELEGGWPGLRVESVQYERLTLGKGEGAWAAEVEEDHPAARLWLGLAGEVWTPGADEEAEEPPDEPLSAEALARALSGTARSGRPPPAVARHFLRIAEELAEGGSDTGWEELKERFSQLIAALTGDDVQAVLEGGTDREERTRFRLASASWLPVGPVVDLVEAAARAGEVDVSHWVLRLLAKMARHTEEAEGSDREEADASFRETARRAITGWHVQEDQPEQYSAALKGMSGASPVLTGAAERPKIAADAANVLQMSVELGQLGDHGERAYRSMMEEGREAEILEILSGLPEGHEAAGRLWRELGTVESLRRLLDRSPPDFEAVGRLVDRLGTAAGPPLIDILSDSEDRAVRRHVFNLLAELGVDVAADFIQRLEEDDRWYVKRNMLALLGEVGELPGDFEPRLYLRHDHPAVRYEAYKILLEQEEGWRSVLKQLFDERAPRLVRLAFAYLPASAPKSLMRAALRHVADEELDDKLRAWGIQSLSHAKPDGLRDLLVDLCQQRHPWLVWRSQLAEKSPVLIAALQALRENWPEYAVVHDVLEMARSSGDPEIRRAAGPAEGRVA